METVKTVSYKKPVDFLYKDVLVKMNEGGIFKFRVTEAAQGCIGGFDEEGINLRIYFDLFMSVSSHNIFFTIYCISL